MASGEYASIDQSGGVITVATPYDDKLAELNGKLVGTAVGWGRYRSEVAEKVSASRAMPKSSAADRAGFLGLKGGAVTGAGDVVKDAVEGRLDVAAAPAAALPEELAGLDADGRKEWVAKKKAERETIQAEINKLNLERTKYLKERRKADAFDARVEDTIRAQAKSIGVSY
jgi:hypothetical protein